MDKVKLGNRIKAERRKQNISQKQLAEMIGIDPTVYCRIENGEKELSIENLINISDALCIDVNYFLFDSMKPETKNSHFEKIINQAFRLNMIQRDFLIKVITVLIENADQWETHKSSHNDSDTALKNSKVVEYAEIGKRMRAERIKQGLTLEKLSENASLSENFLGNIERAASIPSLESLFKIANALNVPITRFLINANKNNPYRGLCDAVEELSRSADDKNALLLNMLAILIDNSNKW